MMSEVSSPHLEHCLITANGRTGITMHAIGWRIRKHCEPTLENCFIVDNDQAGIVGGNPHIIDSLIQE